MPARVHCFGIDELDGERGELRKAKAAAAAAGPGAADSADASGAPPREWGNSGGFYGCAGATRY
jgi:hypothetical protein